MTPDNLPADIDQAKRLIKTYLMSIIFLNDNGHFAFNERALFCSSKISYMKILTPVFILALLLASCSSTYITSSWKAANSTPARFKKLVVIGLVGESERKARESMEKHMVDDLKGLGYNAVCSCEEYSPETFKGMNEKEAIAKLREEGVDGILTIVLLDKKKEKYYVPGRTMVEGQGFWQYYQRMQELVYVKGYYEESTKYYWETNLYNLSENQLLYSIQSQSFDPATTEILAHEYGKKIIGKMVKNDVLVQQDGRSLKPM